jgi:hypothetical protein
MRGRGLEGAEASGNHGSGARPDAGFHLPKTPWPAGMFMCGTGAALSWNPRFG